MQVIIELRAKEPGIYHSTEEARKKWNIFRLYELLTKLEEEGYAIHSLYGSFVFDNEKRSVIDVGKPGDPVHASLRLAIDIHESGGVLAVVFTEEKYVVFANSYFVAIHFCHMRKCRPISVAKALKRFKHLFVNERKGVLSLLYRRQFEEYYGIDAKPVSCIQGDRRIHRHGYAFQGPFRRNPKDVAKA